MISFASTMSVLVLPIIVYRKLFCFPPGDFLFFLRKHAPRGDVKYPGGIFFFFSELPRGVINQGDEGEKFPHAHTST